MYDRWIALASAEAAPWNERAALAASWLNGVSSVLDLGCGTMILENYLQRNVEYIPSDLTSRDERTIICDYNNQSPPLTSAEAVTCLGLLEYLYDPIKLLVTLRPYKRLIISYCITDAPIPLEPRRSHGWVNDLDRAAVESLLRQAGWVIERSAMVDNVHCDIPQ